jgi:diketogulonate reductase-like aldo/keto reductase
VIGMGLASGSLAEAITPGPRIALAVPGRRFKGAAREPHYRQVDPGQLARSLPGIAEISAPALVAMMGRSPIGGITSYRGTGSSTFDAPAISAIATAHGKTPAQVMIRWHLQEGRCAIPKSVRPERITENFEVFDVELTTAELAALDALDTGVRGGPEPDDVTLEAFGRAIPAA